MKQYHIVNPAAGQGTAKRACTAKADENTVIYETTGKGDARCYLARVLAEETEDCRVTVWGGDGTVGEAVSGVIDAHAADRVLLSVHPSGTGNDLVRMFRGEPKGSVHTLDVVACADGTHVLNMINIGFDCAVVTRTAIWKKRPLISGTLAYLCGVVDVFLRPLGTQLTIRWVDTDGASHEKSGRFLLCAIGNAQYCGGGFRGVPCASLYDGVADIMLVHMVPRIRFLGLVGKYRAGTHIENGRPAKGCEDVIEYIRCTDAVISGMQHICRDGEVSDAASLSFSVLPSVIRYEVL